MAKAMEAVKSLEAAAKNSPAYGAWNVQKATMDPSPARWSQRLPEQRTL